MTRPFPALLVLFAMLLAACGDTPGDVLPDPRDGRSGIRLSGQLGDRQIAVSDGLPQINFTDCDVAEGPDRDICILTDDISGELIIVVFENPDGLVEGVTLPVADPSCSDAPACDEVSDVAIVEVQVGADNERVRAVSGRLFMEVVVPLERYRGDLRLRLPDGSDLNASFDIVPRPEEISASQPQGQLPPTSATA